MSAIITLTGTGERLGLLSMQICHLINDFERETGLTVDTLTLSHRFAEQGRMTSYVEAKVGL
jgi:hypothetical protein